jgi:hypothetical protein
MTITFDTEQLVAWTNWTFKMNTLLYIGQPSKDTAHASRLPDESLAESTSAFFKEILTLAMRNENNFL